MPVSFSMNAKIASKSLNPKKETVVYIVVTEVSRVPQSSRIKNAVNNRKTIKLGINYTFFQNQQKLNLK